MPVRTRLAATPLREVDPLSAFKGSADGCSNFLGGSHYRNREEAGRAWEKARRAVWATTSRFTVPRPAKIYDGLSTEALDFARWAWQYVGRFDLKGALAALAEDRGHLAKFEQTHAARDISDYLELFRHDLDRIEQTARHLAAVPADAVFKPYPKHLSVATTYGYVDRSDLTRRLM